MSAVVGIDLSTRALDLVKLNESDNRAEWVRCELPGKDAWARTLAIREALLEATGSTLTPSGNRTTSYWWDDVYLVAVEAPYGRGQAGTNAVLNRVVGAVVASLPARLRVPERCWVVRPDEWKSGLGLKGKPTKHDVGRLAGVDAVGCIQPGSGTRLVLLNDDAVQNARDAYCLALHARTLLERAVNAA